MKRKIIILIPSKIFLAIRNFYLGIFGVFMLEVYNNRFIFSKISINCILILKEIYMAILLQMYV